MSGLTWGIVKHYLIVRAAQPVVADSATTAWGGTIAKNATVASAFGLGSVVKNGFTTAHRGNRQGWLDGSRRPPLLQPAGGFDHAA